jgi:hypothetical protein
MEGGAPPLMFREPQAGITRYYLGANPSIPDEAIRAECSNYRIRSIY